MQNESVPVTIPPDVQQRHEREAKAIRGLIDEYTESGEVSPKASVHLRDAAETLIAAARSEYTRMAGEVEVLKASLNQLFQETVDMKVAQNIVRTWMERCKKATAERDQLRAELEAARARIAELESPGRECKECHGRGFFSTPPSGRCGITRGPCSYCNGTGRIRDLEAEVAAIREEEK